ncbi:type III secretion system HrpP C-terminal domain-containing protein [Brenneria rubrifaciens]|uniref:Type III secretion protein n=1 Tax=Brenneria rubrifaciens TaxID=55213 RepID=A0A4P8QNG9_9GAMM|nr:type III secretion system HrpP C-terminal domain-containing protein [Brenneria rubrifaciens]QCR08531.1 type III secretion protein [Brenneria rubrifaciens]
MNNRLTSSLETAANQTTYTSQRNKSAQRSDGSLHDDFWEAFRFSDDDDFRTAYMFPEGFEQAVQQEEPDDIAIINLTPFTPATPQDNIVNAPNNSQEVTPSQWPALQSELIEALDNIGRPPFSFSLQLPELGEVDARLATLAPRGWDISLRFSRESYQKLKDRRESCRRALSDTMGCPVNLSFDSREVY